MEMFKGFKIVQLKFSETSKETWQIFWKPHSVREFNMKKPAGRTLFIINLPTFINKLALKSMMKIFGRTENVFLHQKPDSSAPPKVKYPLIEPEIEPSGYKVGYVVFKNSKSLARAMEFSPDDVLIASTNESPIQTGLSKWKEDYNSAFHSLEELRKEAAQIVGDYDSRKAKEKEEIAKAEEPDEEGWVTVTSKATKRKLAVAEANKKPGKRRRKKKPQLQNFYAFQRKDAQLKHLEEKRKKFEEDGKRMALLRSSRKFKPL